MVDRSELAPVPRIQSARPHIDILRLDHELTTAVRHGPRLGSLEKSRTDALAASVRGNPDVPQH